MKKYLSALMLVLLLFAGAQASEKYLTVGLNASRFYDISSKPLPGYSFGFGWEWKMGSSSALLFSPSFLYRGAKLESKTIWNEIEWLYKDNIWCRLGYLDLPFSYRHYLRKSSLFFSTGLSISLALYDGSNIKVVSRKHISGHFSLPYDYTVNIDPGPLYVLESSSLDFLLGSGIRLSNVAIVGLVRFSGSDVDTIAGIHSLKSNFGTFSILGSWYF